MSCCPLILCVSQLLQLTAAAAHSLTSSCTSCTCSISKTCCCHLLMASVTVDRCARRIDALGQCCLCMLLGIKWYQFVRNDYVRRLTKQPKLTAIIQSCRLTLFGHIMRMDDNTDAKRILLVSPPAEWRRQPGRPRITWLSTVQQDLKQHHLMLPEAADLAQNRPLWRMMSTYGATQSQSCMPETMTTTSVTVVSLYMSHWHIRFFRHDGCFCLRFLLYKTSPRLKDRSS